MIPECVVDMAAYQHGGDITLLVACDNEKSFAHSAHVAACLLDSFPRTPLDSPPHHQSPLASFHHTPAARGTHSISETRWLPLEPQQAACHSVPHLRCHETWRATNRGGNPWALLVASTLFASCGARWGCCRCEQKASHSPSGKGLRSNI